MYPFMKSNGVLSIPKMQTRMYPEPGLVKNDDNKYFLLDEMISRGKKRREINTRAKQSKCVN